MVYTLWDIQTNNLVAEFGNAADALSMVRRGIKRNGSRDTEALALEVEDQEGDVREIAHGQALADLARSEAHSGVRVTRAL